MIRPSALNLAEHCSMAAHLAEQFPETSDAAERGNVVDEQVTRDLSWDGAATDPDAVACVGWARANLGALATLHVQERVELVDPETGDVLTAGTPDLQGIMYELLSLETIDWKKREQYAAGRLTGPDDNLQTHSYSIARALKCGAQRYRNTLVLFGDGKVEALRSRWYETHEWWEFIDRIRAIQGKKPEAKPGAHCLMCYQRPVCASWRERAVTGLSLIEAKPTALALTDEKAGELQLRIKAIEEAVEFAKDIVKAHRAAGGKVLADGKEYAPSLVKGRASVDAEALKRDGLYGKYLREGAPYERWAWKRAVAK